MGAVNPLVTEVDLAAAVGWALAPLPDADRVVVQLDPDLPPAVADPGLLDRVLANVIENALHYSPDDTQVGVSGCQADGFVSLRVVDHGPGVPSSRHAALFTPFQRLDDVPAGTGLGLGLAAARGLAEAMNATLAATETPGGGLTMTIRLPAAGLSREEER